MPTPAWPPSPGVGRPPCPPRPFPGMDSFFLPTNVPNEGTESQRITGGGVRVDSLHRALHLGFPTQGASTRAVGVGFSVAGREAFSCRLAPTPPPPCACRKMPALCGSHGPLCSRQHPGGGRAALTMLSLARPPAPQLNTCVLTFAHACVPGHQGKARWATPAHSPPLLGTAPASLPAQCPRSVAGTGAGSPR